MADMQDAVRRLTIESTAKGVSETAEQLKKLGEAHAGVTVESQKTERATQSMEKRLESIQKRYDSDYRAQKDLAKLQRDLDAARGQGLITLDRQNQLMGMAKARIE